MRDKVHTAQLSQSGGGGVIGTMLVDDAGVPAFQDGMLVDATVDASGMGSGTVVVIFLSPEIDGNYIPIVSPFEPRFTYGIDQSDSPNSLTILFKRDDNVATSPAGFRLAILRLS